MKTAFLVSHLLLLAIAPLIFGMFGTIFLVVPGVSMTPLLVAVPCHLTVFGIGLQFLAVILGPPPALAFGFTAYELLGTVTGWLKRIVAIRATSSLGQADSSAYGNVGWVL